MHYLEIPKTYLPFARVINSFCLSALLFAAAAAAALSCPSFLLKLQQQQPPAGSRYQKTAV
jgi:hypothetical protein